MTQRLASTTAEDGIRPGRTRVAGILSVEARSARAFGRHTHDDFGIGVVLDGAQDSASGRGPVRAERGQVITVNPGEVHDGAPVGGGPRHWRMLYLRPEVMAGVLAGLDLPAGSELAHPVLDRPATAQAFLALHASLTDDVAPGLARDALLLETVGGLVALRDRAVPRAQAVDPARRAIDDDPAADLPLAHYADLCGLSRFHFLRAFRAATGLTPHAYRIQRRLHAAHRLIRSGCPLAEAAVACGFADQPHLNRHFVRSYGYSPGVLARG